MDNIFTRRRDGVPEDRRTWALFLALRRHRPLLDLFLTDVLGLPVDDAGERVAEPWPVHYAGCQPDGEIRVGDQWLLVFEAKVRGNLLTAAQIDPYLGQAGKRAGAAKLGLVTFLHEKHASAEVAAVVDQHGARLIEVGHQQLLGHLRAWSAREGDPVLALLAGDLARFLADEADAIEPAGITATQLTVYDLAAAHVHAVDAQMSLRLEALRAELSRRGIEAQFEHTSREWMLWTADFIPRTGITAGVTVGFDGGAPSLHWWLQVDESGCHGAPVAQIAEEVLGARPTARDDDGPWWYASESGKEFLDPGDFEKALSRLADRMQQEISYGAKLWTGLVRAAFASALPPSLPANQRHHLRRVLDAEMKGVGTIRLERDALRVTGRAKKPTTLVVCWSGEAMRSKGTLTLWVVPGPARITFSGGKWQEAGKRGRFATISSAAALLEALLAAEIL